MCLIYKMNFLSNYADFAGNVNGIFPRFTGLPDEGAAEAF